MFITPRYIRLMLAVGTAGLSWAYYNLAQIHYVQGWLGLGLESALADYVQALQVSTASAVVAVPLIAWVFAPQRLN